MFVNYANQMGDVLEKRAIKSQNNGLKNDSKKLGVFPIVKIVFRSLTRLMRLVLKTLPALLRDEIEAYRPS